jgi:Putative zinc-finger
VKCNEFQEYISDGVDNRLPEDRQVGFSKHKEACHRCENEFESDRIAKAVVRQRLPRVTAPTDLHSAIMHSLNARNLNPRWFSFLFGGAFLNPAIALVIFVMVAFGAVRLMKQQNAIPLPNDRNIIQESVQNYSAVMAGVMKPSIISHAADDVNDFLSKDVPFAVNVVDMGECEWCGGVLSNFKGVKVAHVLYKIGDEGMLYVCQIDLNEAMHGTRIGLPENVKAALNKTGLYFEQTPSRHSIMLWKYKNTLCSAVSKMDEDHMLALLTP